MPIRLKLLSNLQQILKSSCYIPHRIIVDVIVLVLVLSFIIFVAYMTQYSPHQHDREYLDKFRGVEMTDTNNPDLNYGIVIDCGSSGSRVFVYYWPSHSGDPHDLLDIHQMRDVQRNPIVKKIRPGIAKIDNADMSADYLKPLLDYASEHIPRDKHRSTLLYILATAGMRMLANGDQEMILNNLRNEIPKMYPFLMADTHAEVISGKQEGVFTWVAINYVLGRFDHADRNDETITVKGYSEDVVTRRRTVGVIDMGGASTQIAFEVPKGVEIHQNLMAEFNLGCDQHNIEHEYLLYVTTFLKYGGDATRHRYERMMVRGLKANSNISSYYVGNAPIKDPCLPVGYSQHVEHRGHVYEFVGKGDYHGCQHELLALLNQTVNCQFPPCSINGVHQPQISDSDEFYGFSEFYYTMYDIYGIGGSYNHDQFQTISENFCSSNWATLKNRFDKGLYPNADLKRLQLQCFKSAWMTTVMHTGFEISTEFDNFRSASFVNDREVQWTLGAILYKSRFLPLREIQKTLPNNKPPWLIASKFAASPYLLIMCIIVVCGAILLYIIRLRRLKSQRYPQFNRVPSMSYFMTDEGQTKGNIHEKSINVHVLSH